MTAPADGTEFTLLDAGRRLFPRHGFDGTSIRAITREAHANLGAVTYHFGSKQALYEAVVRSLALPFRERLAVAAAEPGTPLDRLERVVRAFFGHLAEHPELPRLILHQLASERPMPETAIQVLRANHQTIATVIAEGQRDGSVRAGDPRLLALSIGSQPMLLTLIRRVLEQAVVLDQQDPGVWRDLVDSVAGFVRAGLAAPKQGAV